MKPILPLAIAGALGACACLEPGITALETLDPGDHTEAAPPDTSTPPGSTSRGRNNGFGNGDQDPPGNSGPNNNAENDPGGRSDPRGGKGGEKG